MSTIDNIINRKKTSETQPKSKLDVELEIHEDLEKVRQATQMLLEAYNRLQKMSSRERELEGYISFDPVRLVATVVKREQKHLNVQQKMFAHPRQGEY